MKFKILFLAVLIAIFVSDSLWAGPLFCPGAGVDVDIATEVPAIWFANVNMPILWMDPGIVGFSVVPSLSFGSIGFHGFVTAEAMFVFSLSQEKPVDLLLSGGAGIGAYYHEGIGEFTPIVDFGVLFLFNRICLRFAGVAMIKLKYKNDVDTSLTLTLGYGLGERNR